MSEIVQYSLESNVAQITLNRPEALNALNGALLQQLTKNVTDAANDQNVRALIITGTGRAFSSGGDLRGVGTDDPLDPLKNAEQLRRYEEISLLLSEMPKPTIAALPGAAAGAGLRAVAEAERGGLDFEPGGLCKLAFYTYDGISCTVAGRHGV